MGITMATIADVLKKQITDLTNKAIKKHLADLRSTTATHDRAIARLTRQVSALEQRLVGARRSASTPDKVVQLSTDGRRDMRFQAKGLVSLRTRLGLSRAKFGKLVGVSGISVYNWERKKARPRPAVLSAIGEIRRLGKKEVSARLSKSSSLRSKTISRAGRQKTRG